MEKPKFESLAFDLACNTGQRPTAEFYRKNEVDAYIDKLFKDAVIVFCGKYINGKWFAEEHNSLDEHSYRAMLINIEEIKSKECPHDWLVPSGNRTTCKLCGRDGYIKMDIE